MVIIELPLAAIQGGQKLSRYRASWKDHDNKSGSMGVKLFDPNAAEWDAFMTALTNFTDAVIAMTVGNANPFADSFSFIYDPAGEGFASSPQAQREIKWLCRYQQTSDPSSEVYRLEMPCADLSLLSANSEYLDLTAGVGLALKTAFDAVVHTPEASPQPASLLSVQFVGRNR